MSSSLFEILSACLIMGVGIGADVALATFLRAKAMVRKRTVFFWIFGVTLTHTLFPMVGYLLAHYSINSAPIISPIVGIVAFSFIAYFVMQELSTDSENDLDINHAQLLVTLGLILSVSWDALWSGPAKSAQVIGWSEFWVWSSFLIVGSVVTLFSVCSYLLAKYVHIAMFQPKWLVFDMGQWVQLSIVSYFGLLALLRYTFDVQWPWWILLMMSFVLIGVVLHRLQTKRMAISEYEKRSESNMNYISLT